MHHLLNLHGVLDDVADRLCGRFVHQVFEHQTGEIAVQTLKGAEKQDSLFTAAGPQDNPWRCVTSSLLMSSLEKVRPGIRPLFFSQKMEAKDPEKKMPSTAAKATTRSPGRDNSKSQHGGRQDNTSVRADGGGVTIGSALVADPVEGPVSLPLHAGEGLNSIEQVISLSEIRNNRVTHTHTIIAAPDQCWQNQQKCPTSPMGP